MESSRIRTDKAGARKLCRLSVRSGNLHISLVIRYNIQTCTIDQSLRSSPAREYLLEASVPMRRRLPLFFNLNTHPKTLEPDLVFAEALSIRED